MDKNLNHIGIIMDGNGRWAKQRGLNVNFGHKAGAKTLIKILQHCKKINLSCLTVYAFSKENWQRPKEEIDYLMSLIEEYLDNDLKAIVEEKVKIKFLGNLTLVNETLKKKIDKIEEDTENFNTFSFNICFSYSGREEIVDATKLIVKDVIAGKININDINENSFKNYLYNPEIQYPDLVIRTGGNFRVSNFLLWEIAYSEFYPTPVLWPDFNETLLDEAIEKFNLRKRTYGKR